MTVNTRGKLGQHSSGGLLSARILFPFVNRLYLRAAADSCTNSAWLSAQRRQPLGDHFDCKVDPQVAVLQTRAV